MEHKPALDRKLLMATIYLKDGVALKSRDCQEPLGQAEEIARLYNDSGIDKILLWDLSETKEEHNNTLKVIREINRVLEISSYAYGWTSSIRDIREYLFSGCRSVILCSSDPELPNMIEECQKRYRKDRISLALDDVDILFKKRAEIEEYYEDVYVFKPEILESVINMTELPFYACIDSMELSDYLEILEQPNCRGIGGPLLNDKNTDIMTLKHSLFSKGVSVIINDSNMEWSEFKLDADGLIAVVAQDYATKEVLNYGYMNQEAFLATMAKGKMHYYDKHTGCVTMHGAGTEQFQYLKSLSVDCHKQAILAKVSQIGVACHTGNYSCFYTEIMKKDYTEKNTVKVLENIYNVIVNRKKYPREGSFTNFLMSKGLNEIARRIQSESTELILSAKDQDAEALRTELSDLIYFMMVLMCENNITWDDVINEMAQRK